jgi:hypothetical protein
VVTRSQALPSTIEGRTTKNIPLIRFYRPLRLLAHALSVVFVLGALADMVRLVNATEAFRLDRFIPIQEIPQGPMPTLVTVVLFAIFVSRANKNVRRLGVTDLETGVLGSFIVFFVPIGNFWLPYFTIKEIWQASTKPSDPRVSWRYEPTPALLPIWWLIFVLYAVVSNAAAVVSRAHGVEVTPAWVAIVVAPVSIASSVLSVWVVQTLAKIQKARSQEPAPADLRVDFAGHSGGL